jgi:hypothetical protein
MTAASPPARATDDGSTCPSSDIEFSSEERLGRCTRQTPLDDRTRQLVELAVAIATVDGRALRGQLQRARDLGITDDELEQVIALAAPTIGKPATLAAYDAASVDVPTALDSSSPKPSDA